MYSNLFFEKKKDCCGAGATWMSSRVLKTSQCYHGPLKNRKKQSPFPLKDEISNVQNKSFKRYMCTRPKILGVFSILHNSGSPSTHLMKQLFLLAIPVP